MGRHWAWMGVVGVCALLPGCGERGSRDQAAPVAARAPAPARPGTGSAPERMDSASPGQGTAALPGTAPARTGTSAQPGTVASNAPPQPVAPAPAAPGTTVTESGTTQEAPEGRVMIGSEAVQARDDEAWHEGAAKAARAFKQNESVPLDKVVIATGTVDGRVTRVDKGSLHLRDTEGNVYQLRIDKKSRGLRQGQSVPLRQIEEGTSVRASFDLVGGDSIARDIEVRR
jgi:hypothetical protein